MPCSYPRRRRDRRPVTSANRACRRGRRAACLLASRHEPDHERTHHGTPARHGAFTPARIVALVLIGAGDRAVSRTSGSHPTTVCPSRRARKPVTYVLEPCTYSTEDGSYKRRLRHARRAREPGRPAGAAHRAARDPHPGRSRSIRRSRSSASRAAPASRTCSSRRRAATPPTATSSSSVTAGSTARSGSTAPRSSRP